MPVFDKQNKEVLATLRLERRYWKHEAHNMREMLCVWYGWLPQCGQLGSQGNTHQLWDGQTEQQGKARLVAMIAERTDSSQSNSLPA